MSDNWESVLGSVQTGRQVDHALGDVVETLFQDDMRPLDVGALRRLGAMIYGALIGTAGPEAAAEWVTDWLPQARALAASGGNAKKSAGPDALKALLGQAPPGLRPAVRAAAHLARAGSEASGPVGRFLAAGTVALLVAQLEVAGA